ncbi:class I SAM-dependent methyltransferase [Mycobacterium kubicae]|uniref:Methyltransferase domain-containing protein n=1 Tax=Mycobacterium kubicae TaxID=120959 RepID=A0AAX1JEM1_9MYCO|nr:methyltransferase domain-containing protein [Mycobacterium kubicae]MCV7095507.1 methyltransferase domain-containing protein [Mycobacterium kubicae]QPI39999.1 methyltransferase domain-containing protein [Mycobacterium kubicae]
MTALYDDRFYADQRGMSTSSASVVVPIIQEIADPHSVLDVGCGVGTWISVWTAAGVSDVNGVDGNYVNRALLEIPPDQFVSHDLTKPLDMGRRYDLVTCLEVAEHLPPASAPVLVESLVRHADVIVFSAAVPGQGGTGHVNEQWPSYWAEHFAEFGFRPFDVFRDRIWFNERVEWWYRQNCLLFATDKAALRLRLASIAGPLDVVHPLLYQRGAARPLSLHARLTVKAQAGIKAVKDARLRRTLRGIKRS